MLSFTYTIQDPEGIHARPAGLLVKKAQEFKSKITVEKGEKTGDLKKVFSLMALAAKKGDEIKLTFEGDDEEVALSAVTELIKKNL